ncbi:7123_t:CDS:10 [Ambispora leptoticha]|uniref:7123_t:CDS:1 n=1 Tax=Ambispora leptoticha TaxID=144679 RepID=A0A9N8YTP0_9GLOM|nr:7123_t:CDS:10 [Ambispora leptoticha]
MYYAQFENGLVVRGILALQKHIHTRTMKPYFVEFVDAGGSIHRETLLNSHAFKEEGERVMNGGMMSMGSSGSGSGFLASSNLSMSRSLNFVIVNNNNLINGKWPNGKAPEEYDFDLQIGDRNLHVPILGCLDQKEYYGYDPEYQSISGHKQPKQLQQVESLNHHLEVERLSSQTGVGGLSSQTGVGGLTSQTGVGEDTEKISDLKLEFYPRKTL